ncbi:MAG: thioredoxin [Carnobacterium sp.]|uniref:thioredoxin n=1 Tax=Carnobacterium sp. TaxID=48221 RepID=UPI003314596E
MKKKVLVFLFLTSFLVFSGCKSKSSDNFDDIQQSDSSNYESLVEDFEIITIAEIKEKRDDNDKFLLYIGRKTCPYCQIFAPKLHTAAEKENIKIYYLDTENISENDDTDLFLQSIELQYVPSLIYFNKINEKKFLDIDSENITVEEISNFIK